MAKAKGLSGIAPGMARLGNSARWETRKKLVKIQRVRVELYSQNDEAYSKY